MVFRRKPLSFVPTVPKSSEEQKRLAELKNSIYKTVAIFSGLCRKNLWVKYGPLPCTDGREILIPFEDPYAYRFTEHEIAHNLFRSNPKAKNDFVAEFAARVIEQAAKSKVQLPVKHVEQLIDGIVQTLEDYRVDSLWQVLYPGSFQIGIEMGRDLIRKFQVIHGEEPPSLVHAMQFTPLGWPIPDGSYKRFEPKILRALQMTRRHSFSTSLISARWLITELVNEVIREAKDMPTSSVQSDLQEALFELVGEGDWLSEDEGTSRDWSKDNPFDKDEAADSEDGSEAGAADATPSRDPRERAEALRALLQLADVPNSQSLVQQKGDLVRSKFVSQRDKDAATKIVGQALRMPIHDSKMLNDFLDKSERAMKEVIDYAREALFKQLTPDEVLQKNAMAKVVIRKADPEQGKHPLTPAEREAIRR